LQGAVEFGELRPQNLLDEALRGTHHYGVATLPMIAIGPQSVTAAQGKKQMARPLIGHRELHLDRRVLSAQFRKTRPDPFQRCLGRQPLAGGSGAGKQSLDLPQLLAQVGFGRRGRALASGLNVNPTIQLRSRQSLQLTYPPQRATDLWATPPSTAPCWKKALERDPCFCMDRCRNVAIVQLNQRSPHTAFVDNDLRLRRWRDLNVEGRSYLMSWVKSGKFSISAGPPMHAALGAVGDERAGGHSGRLNTICERYLAMVADELARLDPFTAAEWRAICDANNGVMPYADAVGTRPSRIWANVHDTPGLGDKWDIDQVALAQKLRRLPRTTLIAIEEALDRFWSHTEMDTDEAFRVAGIMRTE
jgi:hypothetical protein